MPLPKNLKELLALPTAAFVESAVMDYLSRRCRKLPGVAVRFDRFGNLLARYRHRPRAAVPLVFSAHTDHPGFVARKMRDSKTLIAAFRGWVEPEYFPAAKARFWSDGRWIKARVLRVTKATPLRRTLSRTARPEEVELRVTRPVAAGSPGMWDLPEPALRGDRVTARGCDDIAGCASMLALLERLSKKRARADVFCLFTRAEEVGFVGAIAAAKARTIPKKLPIIAIETSKTLPNAPIGAGPILRVGDKASVFTPAVTAFCDRVAKKLQSRRKNFAYQRKLMDGGTCESTAFIAYGHAATGVCVALGNYHNMDTARRRIASEFISLNDWTRMVDWFEALVLDDPGYGAQDPAMRDTLESRFSRYRPLLDKRG